MNAVATIQTIKFRCLVTETEVEYFKPFGLTSRTFSAARFDGSKQMRGIPCPFMNLRAGERVEITVRRLPREESKA